MAKFVKIFVLYIALVYMATPVFATEPGGASLIVFFAGLIFAPLLQLMLYPILVFADSVKPWAIVALGVLSLAWSAYVSDSLAGPYAAIYFVFTIIIFVIAYFMKLLRIRKNQQENQDKS